MGSSTISGCSPSQEKDGASKRMNTRQLSHFLSVLENCSILRAAAQLNLSQPALSKSISKLEDEYGTLLFERRPRGVRPTAFAFTLERHARRILADIERSRRTASDTISGSLGDVLIGTGPVFVHMVSAAVRDMLAEHPNIKFSVIQGHNAALRSALLANSIDLFVAMISGYEDTEQFTILQLVADKIVCVCRRGHPLMDGRPLASDLLHYGWILPEEGETGRTMLETYFRNRELPPMRVQITTNSDRVVRYFLQQTDLIGLLPEIIVDHPEYHDIAIIPLQELSLSRKAGIVRRREQHFSHTIEIFEKFLGKHVRSVKAC